MPLTVSTIITVKASIPVLEKYGLTISSRMYDILFEKYPDTRAMFSQAPEQQPNILAAAVAAYARNIDNLGSLADAVSKISKTHVRNNVKPEHYPMLGDALFTAMQDVLGDAATPEVLEAWKEAYFFLSDILIEQEQVLYDTKATA
jgi:nitric oxide dioxygenase